MIIHLFPELGLVRSKFIHKKCTNLNMQRFISNFNIDGYWGNYEHRKLFFIDFAKKRGLDPLVPAHWHSVLDELKQNSVWRQWFYLIFSHFFYLLKAAKSIFKYHKGSVIGTLQHLFPSVSFANLATASNKKPSMTLLITSNNKVIFNPDNYWDDIAHLKEFYYTYANEHGFDPLVPSNWYNTATNTLQKHKVLHSNVC